MLTILFKILGILGILLLVLLGIALTVILLVLFFPLCYKASGQKSVDEMRFSVKVRWLFGLVRIFYDYPQPGKLLAKILFLPYMIPRTREKRKSTFPPGSPQKAVVPPTTEIPQEAVPPASDSQPSVKEPIPEQKSTKERGFFNKIRYTVGKICDKIKHILNNITFYKDLWNDPETRGLLRHAGNRIGHILKSLRPRKLELTARIGTGSPDTTGYLYGIYGMILPQLGKDICITPDFEQAILEGNFKTSGHFTLACVVFHTIACLWISGLSYCSIKSDNFKIKKKNNRLKTGGLIWQKKIISFRGL